VRAVAERLRKDGLKVWFDEWVSKPGDHVQAKIAKALVPGGKGKVFCPDCGKPIALRDVIEEKFDSPAVKEQVREMEN
jgi:hypothetical protein